MFILEFNANTFSFYNFSQNILLSSIANKHLHIILTETNYVIYDNDSRIVYDVGAVSKNDWIKILEPTFVHVVHEKILATDDILSNLKITVELFNTIISANNTEEKFHQYFIKKINTIISQINSRFISIKNFQKKIEKINNNIFGKNSKLFLKQIVVNGNYSLEDTDAWYLAWSLDLVDNISYESINIGDIEFADESEVLIHPRARILKTFVKNKYNLITQILKGNDTFHFNKSGIEFKIRLDE